MNRTLTAVAALATLLIVIAPASAKATTSGDQAVTANVENSLEAIFPPAYAWGDLAPGAHESGAQMLTVHSNASWGLKAASDLADGRMREHDGIDYVAPAGKVMTVAPEVKLDALGGVSQEGSYATVSSAETLLAESLAATGVRGAAVSVKYRQEISYADRPLHLNSYRVEVTYVAAQGF